MSQYISWSQLKHFCLRARDGEVGKLKDMLFDDLSWGLRYYVVNSGGIIDKNEVLISPLAVRNINYQEQIIDLNLSCKQIEASPGVQEKLPVSRHYEQELFRYYGWAPYWEGDPILSSVFPPQPYVSHVNQPSPREPLNPHLRSAAEVIGYRIETEDHRFGHVSDFILDEAEWRVGYIGVSTRNWLPGKNVLIRPDWVEAIDCGKACLNVTMNRSTITSAPDTKDIDFLSIKDMDNLNRYFNWLETKAS